MLVRVNSLHSEHKQHSRQPEAINVTDNTAPIKQETDPDARLTRAKSLAPLRQMLAFLWPHKSRLLAAGAALIFTAGAQLTL